MLKELRASVLVNATFDINASSKLPLFNNTFWRVSQFRGYSIAYKLTKINLKINFLI